ncbi:MAG: low specificity L-threonine aldolase [Alphaproteobacteria bacterium]|nr:MAG: low specificity L-threonine aldolase [Alphaproteobacteria bacterium]
MFLASDNGGPAAPEILAAVQRANEGHSPAYGADALMAEVTRLVREIFEAPEAEVRLVATGTAANALALGTLTEPWQTVFCHREAHVQEDECGAPEFYTAGAKLTLIGGEHARIDPDALARAISETGAKGVHGVQRGPVSLTQATELGAVYSPAELARITALARAAGLPVHMDGARFANALVSLGTTPAEATWRAGVDVLCLGGTKNGLLGAEAVIFFDPAHVADFDFRRKRGGHLFSKHRYLSAQFAAYLTDGLWLELATRANRAAARLAAGLAGIEGASILHPVEANMVFAALPRRIHRRLRAAGAEYYLWPFEQSLDGDPEAPLTMRLVTDWSMPDEVIDRFLEIAADA